MRWQHSRSSRPRVGTQTRQLHLGPHKFPHNWWSRRELGFLKCLILNGRDGQI